MNSILITFLLFSIFISYLDIKQGSVMRIYFLIAFIIIFLQKIFFLQSENLIPSFFALFTGLILFGLAYFISKKKLGLADVWYSGLIAFVFGIRLWYNAIIIACLLGLFFILFFRKQKIPFIPFMTIGSIILTIFYQIS